MMIEYRAVFENTQGEKQYGPNRDSLETALKDRPQRNEEWLGGLIGVQKREITPWISMMLSELTQVNK